MRLRSLVLCAFALAFLPSMTACAGAAENLSKIKLPAGFKVSVFAEVKNARAMTLSPKGTLFVGSREADTVYAVTDTNGDHVADKVYTTYNKSTLPDGSKFDMPSGVAFRDGSLYVSSVSRIIRFDDIESKLDRSEERRVGKECRL